MDICVVSHTRIAPKSAWLLPWQSCPREKSSAWKG